MRKVPHIILLLLLPVAALWGQAKTRRLPSIINHPSLNLYAPYISTDGNALLFISDDGEDHSLTVFYTSREKDWSEPVMLPKHVNHRLIYQRGFALSADGKKMYFTAAKSPVVGGYDIMTSEIKGSTWSEPQNMMVPINSKTNEGCPSLTPDGNTIFFMRCDQMDQNRADRCKLFSSRKKPNGQWEEPAELPASINTGNSQTPRIMADGETLIFSSNGMPGSKGGMDLYVTRFRDGGWTDPIALDFVNTDKDDQFVTATALGRYLIKDTPGARKYNELVEFLIPADLRPKGMMKVEGKVTDPASASVPAYITVVDLANGKRVFSGRPGADGSYMLYLMEGTKYELSIDPEQSNLSYYTRLFDLTTDKTPQMERVNAVLKQPDVGDELSLDRVEFKPNTAILESYSETELKRLSRIVKANPQLKFEIQVMLHGYEMDSTLSNPDLTEVTIDSIRTQVDDIDTLGQLTKRDTVLARTIYHNDRTPKQAQSIIEYLSRQGTEPSRFTYFVNAIPAPVPGEKKLVIKAVGRK